MARAFDFPTDDYRLLTNSLLITLDFSLRKDAHHAHQWASFSPSKRWAKWALDKFAHHFRSKNGQGGHSSLKKWAYFVHKWA